MRSLRLALRLARRNLRRRPAQAALLLLTLTLATGMFGVGMALYGSADRTAGLLLVLATINALIIAALAARDSARNHATLRAVGATPRQTTATLVVSQMGACMLAVALGLPLGLGLWSVMDGR